VSRWVPLLSLCCALGCTDEGSENFIGESDVTARGILTQFGRSDTVDVMLSGNVCERLGWVNVRSRDGQSVLVFNPNLPVDVGTYLMQSDDNAGPVGWLNTVGVGGSLKTMRGTTLVTSVTAVEVRGAIDWAVGEPPDFDVPPDPANGEVVIRGTFRAVRIDDDSC
jgi:hypothetical protein